MIYEITGGLPQRDGWEPGNDKDNNKVPVLIVADTERAREWLAQMDVGGEWEPDVRGACLCKVDAEPEGSYGSLVIPQVADLHGEPYRILFFVHSGCVLLVNEDGYAQQLIERLQSKSVIDGQTSTGRLLFLILTELIAGDVALLEKYEKELMHMEEEVFGRQTGLFMTHMLRIRRQLLLLRSYYEQLIEVGRELEENENELFEKKEQRYFGTFSARAERLLHRCTSLIDYAGQVKEVYQGQTDELQNRNMQFLTVVSTIFFPLTLITGWYGMNFEHMPELAHGYPYVAGISVLVVIVCVWIFKKKKII